MNNFMQVTNPSLIKISKHLADSNDMLYCLSDFEECFKEIDLCALCFTD